MSTSTPGALLEREPLTRPPDGGRPARRAVVRWAWRMFRREWRQQLLILTLLTLAVTATIAGLGVVSNTVTRADSSFGFANRMLILPGSDSSLSQDIAAAKSYFGKVDVVEHEKIAVPGSVGSIDLRAQDPNGPYGYPTLKLRSGRYPTGADEVAITRRVGRLFDLHVGSTWEQDGRSLHVVGIVENPQDLLDAFALVAPGTLAHPTSVDFLVDTTEQHLRGFHFAAHSGITGAATRDTNARQIAAVLVLVLATIGLVFVGLLSVGGFAVLAGRRQRALGMLGAIGATDRHVRLVMVANGAAVGAAAAVVGAVLGLSSWFVFAPTLETLAEHRINRFDLPWWAVGAAMGLAALTAVGAAWWPARAAARVSIVAALSGRPPRPRPPHRFALVGVILLVAGPVLLVLSHEHHALFIVAGIVATTFGTLLLAPLAIRVLALVAGRSPIAVRLAFRDLSRYQARSGAALAAITLAIGIAATITVAAAGAEVSDNANAQTNLAANQLLVQTTQGGGPVPALSDSQLQAAGTSVNAIAAAIGSHDTLALDAAVSPAEPTLSDPISGATGKPAVSLVQKTQSPHDVSITFEGAAYVATPSVLAHYGISTTQIDPDADLLTSRTDLGGLQLMTDGPRGKTVTPTVQRMPLPTATSGPNTLITDHAMKTFGLQAVAVAWLLQAPQALSTDQVDAARKLAAAAGLVVETQPAKADLSRLRTDATAAGVLVALGVLAMTIGLIRSETASDLRTLTATGAGAVTRRTLAAATAGGLAGLGAILGTAGAYLALVAWAHHDLHPLTNVPVAELLAIVVGLPLVAAAGGWLLGGHEPPAIARRPME